MADALVCREWNRARRDGGGESYDDAIFDDLASRFERPERRNRWDSPLFEVFPGFDGDSPGIVEAASYVTRKVARDVKVLQPTIATLGASFSSPVPGSYPICFSSLNPMFASEIGASSILARVCLSSSNCHHHCRLPPLRIQKP